ncbi:MAG: M1 family aminopeptidase/hydrolase, partial [Parvularculaceae bacterium]
MPVFRIFLTCLILLAAACSREAAPGAPAATAGGATPSWAPASAADVRDQFSYSNYEEVRVTHLSLDLAADFDAKVLSGSAELRFRRVNPAADTLILDANGLAIESVETQVNEQWMKADYTLGPRDDVLGSQFAIRLPQGADKVRIVYATSPEAEGLQWLDPEQTWDKTHPYLLTQFQPFFARTMIPLQDTPAVRITYDAHIKTPPGLLAVMSARQDEDGVRDGDYSFRMEQPIPAYLIALAIGDIRHKDIDGETGVYADADMVDAAAKEFEDVPKMRVYLEKLYGPYRWGRYDMLVLPPSFPFGGMENPRLTFFTPTLVTGDKSLVNTVAHEFAHSWSGNLVTNATWRDLWLNEGFTVYVENRIMEELYGEERATMERALERKNLLAAITSAPEPSHTQLKFPADIAHPDYAFTDISYSGGLFFLVFLEERFGRDKLDEFLKSYFDHYAF